MSDHKSLGASPGRRRKCSGYSDAEEAMTGCHGSVSSSSRLPKRCCNRRDSDVINHHSMYQVVL
jgi:hypothetical protein